MVDDVVAGSVFASRYGITEVTFLGSVTDGGVKVFRGVCREQVCHGAKFVLGLVKVRGVFRGGGEGGCRHSLSVSLLGGGARSFCLGVGVGVVSFPSICGRSRGKDNGWCGCTAARQRLGTVRGSGAAPGLCAGGFKEGVKCRLLTG